MIEKINNAFMEAFMSQAKKGYDKDISLCEYLNSFTLKELQGKVLLYFILSDNIHKYITLKQKKKLIDYIMDNIEDIIQVELINLHINAFDGLREIIKNGDANIFSSMSVCNFTLIAEIVKKDNDEISYFIQKDILKILNKLLNNKIRNDIVKRSEIINLVIYLTYLYGILTETEILDYFNKYNVKFDGELFDYIFIGMALDMGYQISKDEDISFVYSCVFESESDAIEYYYTHSNEEICMDYSPQLLKDIYYGKYIKKMPEYKKIWKYLNESFDIPIEDVQNIDIFIIEDFMAQANMSIEEAIVNTRKKLKEEFEISLIEINKIIELLKEMFDKYPKMYKRGKI